MIGKCRWKLLDFALLKRNSVSFFDIEKPETAVSKWSRARIRAAKVPLVFRYHHTICFLYQQFSWNRNILHF